MTSPRDMWEMRVQFARTELALAFTFLHAASMLSDVKRARSLRAAIAALRSVNRFLATNGDDEHPDISRHRDELRARLREFMRV